MVKLRITQTIEKLVKTFDVLTEVNTNKVALVLEKDMGNKTFGDIRIYGSFIRSNETGLMRFVDESIIPEIEFIAELKL